MTVMKEMKEMKGYIEIAKVEDLALNTGKTIRYHGLELAVFRLKNDKVKAIENRCPHKDGVLAEGIVSGEYVFCPLHDRKIDLTSGQVQAPDTGCVKSYDVLVEDGRIYIDFSDVNELVS